MPGVGGFVLAGGRSSRMGRNKALLGVAGQALVVRQFRLVERAVGWARAVGPPEVLLPLGIAVVADDEPGAGPLAAIATALRVSPFCWNLIVAVDMPHLTHRWLAHLAAQAEQCGADVLIPRSPRGWEPLCAVYHRRCLASIRQTLAAGERSVQGWLQRVGELRVCPLEPEQWSPFDPDGNLFANLNTLADYEDLLRRGGCA